jgi:AcrR family transcriptional regulator
MARAGISLPRRALSKTVATTSSKAPARRTQAQRTRETRERVLDSALHVMLYSGYERFRFAELARVSGVSRGAILHHFPTKLDLVAATVEHAYEKALAGSRNRAALLKPSEDPLEAMIADAKEFYFGDFFFVLANMVVAGSESERRISREMSRKYRLPAEEAWRQVLEARDMSKDFAEDAVWLTFGVVRGMALRTLFQNEPERFQRLFDLFRDILWTYWNGTTTHDIAGRKPKRNGRGAPV